MVISLGSALEAAVADLAQKEGLSPEAFVLRALEQQVRLQESLTPRDEWERGLLAAARPCGVSLSNEAVSSEGIYD